MNRSSIWLPLIASIGVGAATFYSMQRNNQGVEQIIGQFMPGQSSNSNAREKSNSGQLGPYGMS